MTPSIVAADDAHGMARQGAVLSIVCRGVLTIDIVKGMVDATERLCREHPGKAGLINVIEAGGPAPDAAVRKAAADMLKGAAGRVAGVAVVVEGSGLRMSLIRNVLSTISLMSKSDTPIKYFETTTEAATWLAGKMGDPNRPADLRQIVEAARSAIKSASRALTA